MRLHSSKIREAATTDSLNFTRSTSNTDELLGRLDVSASFCTSRARTRHIVRRILAGIERNSMGESFHELAILPEQTGPRRARVLRTRVRRIV